MKVNLELAEKAKEMVREIFGRYNRKVNEKLENLHFDVCMSTSHFDRKNTVYINARSKNDLSTYVHELLHAVSTSETFNKQYIGFHKVYNRKIGDDLFVETSLGYAINEGATEHYTRDVLGNECEKAQTDTTYNFCSNIYKNLEKVVTSATAKVLYANGNVDNFIKTISFNAKTSQENVLKLILNMDAFFDTYRIYHALSYNHCGHVENFKSDNADVEHLLANAYTYLAAILSDYKKSRGEKFEFDKDVCSDYLTTEELELFKKVAKKVDTKKVVSNSSATLKAYDRISMYVLTQQLEGNLKNFDMIPNYLKCGEFYNFLLLNTQFCDNNRISYDFKTKDEKAKLTQKIYSEKYHALNIDENLPQHVATMISPRYAIRAGTTTSDYYMMISMHSKKFREYLNSTDPDYYEALCKIIENENSEQNKENTERD